MGDSSDQDFTLPLVQPALEEQALECCVRFALQGTQQEFPNYLPWLMTEPSSERVSPRTLFPAFYGCFDWHSAVHGHWTLVQLATRQPHSPWVSAIQHRLNDHLQTAHIRKEVEFFQRPGRATFERPYGLAWVLQLDLALAQCRLPEAGSWRTALAPLTTLANNRLTEWLEGLPVPIRTGEHNQSALALSLWQQWARGIGASQIDHTITQRVQHWHLAEPPLRFELEPSAHDFLSPTLAVSSLMSQNLNQTLYSEWLQRVWPVSHTTSRPVLLQPVQAVDLADGKGAHWAGLNFSRAWMLDQLQSALATNHPWVHDFRESVRSHLSAGMLSLGCNHYATTHWVGTFATYALLRCWQTSSIHQSNTDPHQPDPQQSNRWL